MAEQLPTTFMFLTTAAVASIIMIAVIYHRRKRVDEIPKRTPTLRDTEAKYSLPLVSKTIVSHDTRRFRFKLPSVDHCLGLPPGQHIFLSAKIDGKLVVRPYTPVSSNDDKGYTELIVKIYFKNFDPRFPDGGKMTQYLESLKIGDTIDFRGPNGLVVYEGKSVFAVKPSKPAAAVKYRFNKLGMIAGGSGITPILQVISAALKDDDDATTMKLIYANKTEGDILLKEELDEWARNHPEKFNVWYVLDTPPPAWAYGSGFVSASMIENIFPKPDETTAALLCGPPPMVDSCRKHLDALQYPQHHQLTF